MDTTDPPLNYASYLTLITFAVVIFFCIHPFRIPISIPRKTGRRRSFGIHLNLATAPLIGIVVLLIVRAIDGSVIKDGFLGSEGIEPYSVLLLVFAQAYLCISIDMTGFFEMLAFKVTRWGGDSGKRLFFYLLLLSTVMTIITSNDVTVLTVTPIICYITQENKLNPQAFLLSNFIVLNIASMTLYIGNPTNVIVAQAFGINFLQYSAWMTLPTLAGLVISFGFSYLVLKNRIPTVIPHVPTEEEGSRFRLRDRNGAIFGMLLLVLCLICLAIIPTIVGHVGVWMLTVPFAVVLLIKDVVWDLCGWSEARREAENGEESGLEEEIPADTFSLGSYGVPTSTERMVGDEEFGGSDSEMVKVKRASVRESRDGAGAGVADADVPVDHHQHPHPIRTTSTSSLSFPSPRNSLVTPIVLEDIPTTKPSSTHHSRKSTTPTPLHILHTHFHTTLPTFSRVTARLPWALIPFSLGMFILVEALHTTGWTARFATALGALSPNLPTTVFVTGAITALACNLLNNLPMTILFARIFQHANFSSRAGNYGAQDVDAIRRGGLFALVVGSNVGANVLFVGSLAGLMWSDLLRKRGEGVPQGLFFRVCMGVTPVVVLGCCGVLCAELVVMGFSR
ncbi:hypothetical protein HDV00_003600 [Rhizophlyctis rosea]|nr:hypothetical protein HDV00_003600 [Rhizophlyctis rosea]